MNQSKIDDFEGLSPSQIRNILYSSYEENSIIKIKKEIKDNILNQIGFLKLTEYYLNFILEQKEIKLTQRGYLPVKIVKELYNTGFVPDEWIESGSFKLGKEMDSLVITLLRIISSISRFTKIRQNKLSLTGKGLQILKGKRSELLTEILRTFCYKYNWAFFDGYGEHQTGQIGFGYTFFLLSEYGTEFHKTDFYAEKYLIAFPAVIEQFRNLSYKNSSPEAIKICYAVRTFDRFLKFFDLIEYAESKSRYRIIMIRKSDIFDKVIEIDLG